MDKGQLVFAQLNAHLPRDVFRQCVARYAGRYPALSFSHWDQFLCMTFAQLTARTSLRDITTCLRSQQRKLFFAGFRGAISRTTLADANERRDSRIFEEFALHLIGVARALYAQEPLKLDVASAYAIDATTIDLCLSIFAWTPAANARAGVKVNTQLDLRGNIPSFVRITSTLVADARFLDHIRLEAGSFYLMDRAYMHFERLYRFTQAAAFFVVRSKNKLLHRIVRHRVVSDGSILSDDEILLKGHFTRGAYPAVLRRIEVHDIEQDRTLILLTNNFELHAEHIARLYKSRWQVELFFKWIKQHLRIKAFVGTSPNAVKTQIWTAICTYVLVAIVKKRLNVSASLHSTMQVLSVNLFERTPLEQLLATASACEETNDPEAQIDLF